jgi:hypothetical protein
VIESLAGPVLRFGNLGCIEEGPSEERILRDTLGDRSSLSGRPELAQAS